VNVLDGLLVVAAGSAAWAGWHRGLIVRLMSWTGAGLGAGLGLLLLPIVMDALEEAAPETRLIAGLLAFFLLAGIGAGLGELFGRQVRDLAGESVAQEWDRSLGAVAGILGVAGAVWLFTPAAADVPAIARNVRTSNIVRLISDTTPRPPDPVAALRTLVGGTRFPEVFDELRPAPDTGPPPDSFAMDQDTLARVTASTSNIEVIGCGARFEGSGFTVADNLVVTNAHVVAGAEVIQVRRPDGRLRDATVISFDDDIDLALLRVTDLEQAPLELGQPVVGADGAVIGYPGGQDTPRATPARVERAQRVTGRDIYGDDRTERNVLFTATRLRQGDSGSPLVDAAGTVVGVVFAIAPDDPDLAYALHVDELTAFLTAPANAGSGRCA